MIASYRAVEGICSPWCYAAIGNVDLVVRFPSPLPCPRSTNSAWQSVLEAVYAVIAKREYVVEWAKVIVLRKYKGRCNVVE